MHPLQPDQTLINPPTELKTRDPLLTIASDTDTATIDLRSLQPRLHKRLTAKVKANQWVEVQRNTAEVFGTLQDNQS
jgi:hypothetical protein